ncbi:MAG: ATP-binding protein [Verrucomicrobiales bacterium]|nr:ATP-binding protein [Verrucomicrobiales bacterium]
MQQEELEQIRSINHHLRQAIEQVEEGVLMVGGDHSGEMGPRIIYVNRAAASLTGYEPDELLGQALSLLYDPEHWQHLLERMAAVLQAGRTFEMRRDCVVKDGSSKAFSWTIRGMKDERGEPLSFVLTLRPVVVAEVKSEASSVKALEADRDQMIEEKLEQSRVESLAMLAGGIAHDFNNELTAITSNLSLTRLETDEGTELRQRIDDSLEACKNAQSLAQQILDFTKGRTPLVQVVRPGKLLKKVSKLAMMGSLVRSELSIPEGIWGVEADERQLRQVLSNLLINACQAMPDGGVVQAGIENVELAEGEVEELPAGRYVLTTVRDRGYGIPEENLKKIFEPYFTTKKTGSGIGLATCLAIAHRHGGTITVESNLNAGTGFKVYLPACGVEQDAASVRQQGKRMEGSSQRKQEVIAGQGCVLVVDDQDAVRQSAQRLLEKLGYRTIAAADGQQAIDLYRQHARTAEPVSAVLLDMTLPGGLDGEEVKDEIRRMDGSARVIATSGWFDDGAESQLLTQGYVGVLPKPYAVEELSQTMHEALRN